MELKVGDLAPDFTLADQTGHEHQLKKSLGRWVLIYFYPKDDTPGCTKEACAVEEFWAEFKRRQIDVFGVSTDSVKSHQKFATKYNLNFPLLADINKKVVTAYGVWGNKKFMGREYQGTYRISFLIDPSGRIAKIYDKVTPATHAAEVLADIPNQ